MNMSCDVIDATSIATASTTHTEISISPVACTILRSTFSSLANRLTAGDVNICPFDDDVDVAVVIACLTDVVVVDVGVVDVVMAAGSVATSSTSRG